MTLTEKGLRYFDSKQRKKIIALPLVIRHLSVYESKLCETATDDEFGFEEEKQASTETVLDFEALKTASMEEVIQYLDVPRVREAYLQVYGKYFTFFDSKITSFNHEQYRYRICGELFPVIDEASEKKLIWFMKNAAGLPVQTFNNALQQQDIHLRTIASIFFQQATKAQNFIATIRERDIAYKENIVKLAFSFLKLGLSLSMVNVGELLEQLVNLSTAISELTTQGLDEFEAKFSSLVSDVQTLVINTHSSVLVEAEVGLFSTVSPEDIKSCWEEYSARVFENANRVINQVLQTCIHNDDFFRCIIRQTICEYPNLTYDALADKAAEKTEKYFKDIVQGLLTQVEKIQRMKDAVVSREGCKKIEDFYIKIGLINYVKQHEDWVSKEVGHRLSNHFPKKIFQKKWTGTLYTIFHRPVPYCKERITPKEYQKRRRQADVVLSTFRNSSEVINKLMACLDDLIPRLTDLLIQQLRVLKSNAAQKSVFFEVDGYRTLRHYSFARRQLSFFNFTDAAEERLSPAEEPASSPISSPVLLTSHRRLSDS